MTALSLSEAKALLRSSRSAQRRRAARRFRELAKPSTGSLVLEALVAEMQDPRTWETQYQLIMAVVATGHTAALPYLREQALTERDATMVSVAIGDGLVRLSDTPEQQLMWCVDQRQAGLHHGALRAAALLRLRPGADAVKRLLEEAKSSDDPEAVLWTAAAAAGWEGEHVQRFLTDCLAELEDELLPDVAREALKGQYAEVDFL